MALAVISALAPFATFSASVFASLSVSVTALTSCSFTSVIVIVTESVSDVEVSDATIVRV